MSKHHLGQTLTRPLGIVAGLVLCLTLGACSSKRWAAEVVTTPQGRALAERAIADLQRGAAGEGDFLAMFEEPDPNALPILPELRAMVPSGAGAQTRLIEGQINISDVTGRRVRYDRLTYEVSRADRRALIRLEIMYRDGRAWMETVQVNPLTIPADDLNPFTFGGKPFTSYLVLALLGVSSAISIAAAILVLRTPGIRMKWLWAFGCLWSFGAVVVDWSSGGIFITSRAVYLLGGELRKVTLLDPWQVTVGLPLIALVFLILRKNLQRPASSGSASASA